MYKATHREIQIPAKDLKQNADIFSDYTCSLFNFCLNEGTRYKWKFYLSLLEYLKSFLVTK